MIIEGFLDHALSHLVGVALPLVSLDRLLQEVRPVLDGRFEAMLKVVLGQHSISQGFSRPHGAVALDLLFLLACCNLEIVWLRVVLGQLRE